MYYIGEILREDLDIHGRPIIELWTVEAYSTKAKARKEIEKIEQECIRQNLEVIDEREHCVYGSKGWKLEDNTL